MPTLTGTLADATGHPLHGHMTAKVTMFRPDGSTVLAPEAVPWLIEDGHLSATLAPGPAVLSLHLGGPPHILHVTIPEHDTTLAALIGDQ